MRKITHWALIFPLIVAACSSTKSAATTTTQPPAATTTAGAPGSTVDYSLVEWGIKGAATAKAGSVTFNVKNDGKFKHELVVVRADSYKALPQEASGHILEDKIPQADKAGEAGEIGIGETKSVTLDLKAGKYVVFCNILDKEVSHAAKGQVIELTVG